MATQQSKNNTDILPLDDIINGLDDFDTNLSSANDGFKDFVSGLNGVGSEMRRLNSSLNKNTQSVNRNFSQFSSETAYSANQMRKLGNIPAAAATPAQPFYPDIGDMFNTPFQHPAMSRNYDTFRTSKPTSMIGAIGKSHVADLNKNLLQLGHTLSPASFMQYSMMFGASFPVQMKMAETITKPVTDVAQSFEAIRGFSSGFTGIGDALHGFQSQMKSPFNMYEGLYQSKILLSSALGGDRQANTAMDTALQMAREYPVKTEQVLSSLTRLAVYPEVKPYLQDTGFQKKLMETVSGLSLIVPEQGMEGAMFSLVEAMSGSWRSLQMRFNVSPEVVQSLSGMTKGEMSSDPNKLISGLHTFISKAVGLDVLEKQKYTFSKQVDNFGDSLQMLTRSVFENTGLYGSATGAATAFQTGFSTLAGNREFLGYIGNIMTPYQNNLDKAIAKFAGIGVGTYKSMPMSEVMTVLESNFKNLSLDEIGNRFIGLIDDVGGVQKDTNNAINKIVDSKFGDVLGKIGGDIADVATKSFSRLTGAVLKGFGQTVMQNPMDVIAPIAAITAPFMLALGGIQTLPIMLNRALEKGTFAQLRGKVGASFQGKSNTQLGEDAINSIAASIKKNNGRVVGTADVFTQAQRVAKDNYTELRPSTINKILDIQLTEISKSLKSGNTQIDSAIQNMSDSAMANRTIKPTASKIISANAEGRIPYGTRATSGRTLNSEIENIKKLVKRESVRKTYSSEYAVRRAERVNLRKAGLGTTQIRKIEDAYLTQVITELEDEKILKGLGGKLDLSNKSKDIKALTRKFLDVNFDIPISQNAFDVINTQRAKIGKSELNYTMDNGFRVTSPIRKSDVNMVTNSYEANFLDKQRKSGALQGEQEFTPKGLQKFFRGAGGGEMPEVVRLLNLTDNQLSTFRRTQLLTEKQLSTLQNIYKENRMATIELKKLPLGSGNLPGQSVMGERILGDMGGLIQQQSNLRALEQSSSLFKEFNKTNRYISPEFANRATRLINNNESSFKGVQIKLSSPAAIKANAGKETVDLLSVINSSEGQIYQAKGLAGFAEMKNLNRGIVTADVFSSIGTDKAVGADIMRGLSGAGKLKFMGAKVPTILSSFFKKSGITKAVSGGMMAIDPILSGYLTKEILSNTGMSNASATAGGVGVATAMGGGMYALSKKQGTATFKKSLMGQGAAGGLATGLATITTALSMINDYATAQSDIQKHQHNYINQLHQIAAISTPTASKLAGLNKTMPDNQNRIKQGYSEAAKSPLLKILLGAAGAGLMFTGVGAGIGAGMLATSVGMTSADFQKGYSKNTAKQKGLQSVSLDSALAADMQKKRESSLGDDVKNLEYKQETTGLSRGELSKLITTRRLQKDAEAMKQLKISGTQFAYDIYSTKAEYPQTGAGRILNSTTAGTLTAYLKSNKAKSVPKEKQVGQALTVANVAIQASSELQKVIDEGVANNDTYKVSNAVGIEANINKLVADQFDNALKNVDFNNVNQVEELRQARVATFNSMNVPYSSKSGMKAFKQNNKDMLIAENVKARILSQTASNKNERNYQSSIDQVTGGKLSAIGIQDPIQTINMTSADYFKKNNIVQPETIDDALAKKLEAYNINVNDLNQRGTFGNNKYNTRSYMSGKQYAINNISGLTSQDKEKIKNISAQQEKYNTTNNDFRTQRADAFRLYAQISTDDTLNKSIKDARKEQTVYRGIDLSKYAAGKQESIRNDLSRRDKALADISGVGGQDFKSFLSSMGINKNVSELSNSEINNLIETPQFQSSKFSNLEPALQMLGITTKNLDGVFKTTSQTTEKKFNFALEKASETISMFSANATTPNISSTKLKEQLNSAQNAILNLKSTGKASIGKAEQQFTEAATGLTPTNKFLMENLGGVSSAKDLITTDENGFTGLDRLKKLSQSGIITDNQLMGFEKSAVNYSQGVENVDKAEYMGYQAAEKRGQLGFQAGAMGSASMPLATKFTTIDWKQRKKLREAGTSELQTMVGQYNKTNDPAEKKRLKMAISGTWDTLNGKLGMNSYQMKAAIGGGLQDQFTANLTNETISKTNSEAQQIALYGKVIKPIKSNTQGYGVVNSESGSQFIYTPKTGYMSQANMSKYGESLNSEQKELTVDKGMTDEEAINVMGEKKYNDMNDYNQTGIIPMTKEVGGNIQSCTQGLTKSTCDIARGATEIANATHENVTSVAPAAEAAQLNAETGSINKETFTDVFNKNTEQLFGSGDEATGMLANRNIDAAIETLQNPTTTLDVKQKDDGLQISP